jgi:hypothetical protein
MVGKFAPGSFTKNYGWKREPPGLKKLHTAINKGFDGTLTAVERNLFRSRSGSGAQLVPVNFFLHNTISGRRNFVTADELVRQALTAPYSRSFDQLALFALHLGKAGARTGSDNGDAAGAAFANDYVRNVLCEPDGWVPSATSLGSIEGRFGVTVLAKAGSDTVHKCATNYRFMLEVVGITGQTTSPLNTRWRDWFGSAAFLLFDRVSVDDFSSMVPDRPALIAAAKAVEFHKLIGATRVAVADQIELLAASYVEEGGLARSSGVVLSPPPTPSAGSTSALTPSVHPKWSDEAAFEAEYVERRLRQVRAQLRKPKNVKELKALYDNHCCFCGRQVQVGVDPDAFYSEAAHIRPLGDPHKGPDVRPNMILLCPEHHLQFDRGMLRINVASMTIESRVPGDALHGKPISVKGSHSIDPAMAQWHFDFWKPI